MNATDILRKKRDGKALTKAEIRWFVSRHVAGQVKDYQASALTMAVFLQGMTAQETAYLTDAFMNSGDIVDPAIFSKYTCDKHSTGGVGDTVSLILAPLAASMGVMVPMVSGRGLGHTGGTLDKLESIPGFRTDLSIQQFIQLTNKIGCGMIGQTDRMCPADKKWYALRDVTATVESIPLIVASIMSKKLAEGINGLVLDVKCGSGAFMKTEADALTLAEALVETGKRMGRQVRAVITDMNQPLAKSAGNALEAAEAIRILQNCETGPLRDLSVELTAHMALLAGKYKTLAAAKAAAEKHLAGGKALARFKKMVKAQGGDPAACDDPGILPAAKFQVPLKAKVSGYLQAVDTMALGLASNALGAGRMRVEDSVDPSVGLTFDVRIGDKIRKGQRLLTLHANDRKRRRDAVKYLEKAYTIGAEKINPPELIKRVVE